MEEGISKVSKSSIQSPELVHESEKFEGNYIQWLWHEIKTGTNKVALSIMFFGIGFQLSLLINGDVNWITIMTFLATIVGLFCTTLTMNGSPANGIIGLISVAGFVAVNASAGHWWSVLDQIIFMCAIDIPLMIKWKTWGQNLDSKMRKLTPIQWLGTFAIIAGLWFILHPVAIMLNDSSPTWDSLVLAIGATASVYCMLHVSDLFVLWLIEDIMNVGLWSYALIQGYSPAAMAMLVSALMYTATAIYGQFFSVWHKNNKRLGTERKLARKKAKAITK